MKTLEYKDLVGRTIASVEVIQAEYVRTYNHYACITFTDGTRVIFSGGIAYSPHPPLDEMRKAPKFFTPEEIANVVLQEERERRRRMDEDLATKRQYLAALKKELGE
jgi:hypothetical protein